jgi:uncharacterized protein
MESLIDVSVAFGTRQQQRVLRLRVPESFTVGEVLERALQSAHVPEAGVPLDAVGIFGRRCQRSDQVHAGDRIEIYRPLVADPKAARRHRARQKRRL